MTPLAPLTAARQWILVKLVPLANGKTDKLPMNPYTGQVTEKGSDGAHNPAIWLDYATAASTAAAWGPGYTVGFVLTAADPFFCLDIDGALQADGTWSPLSQQLCAALPNTVIEISQSGKGLHVWGWGAVPEHRKKNVPLGIELYTERRFIAIGHSQVGDMGLPCGGVAAVVAAYFPPGAAAGETPDEGASPEWYGPTDDAELLRRALSSRSASATFNGTAAFADLWDANVDVLARSYPADSGSSEPYDRSSADAALAQHLAFWTGRDVARIERLMRQSKLAREKWDTREDYLVERTIRGACGRQREVLQDKRPEPGPTPSGPASAAPVAATGTPTMRAVEGSTFLTPEQQAELFKGCVYIVELHRALVPGGQLLKPDSFRATFGGYAFAMDGRNERTTRNAWEAFTESQVLRCPRADGTCFKPQLPYGTIVADAGRTRANTWWPVAVPSAPGDVKPFLTHLAKLFPVTGDQQVMLAYMAFCVQHVGYKAQWCPFIQGVEGNGKTFLSRCVAEAVGRRYTHWPKASKIAKQFNAWMVGKVFYAVEDIHTSEHVDVIEELKPMITGADGLEIEAKGVDQVSAEICGNFLINSNHKSGLRKTRNDRRLCVLYCAQQNVEDLARDGMAGDYMQKLYEWANGGGYAAVTHFLQNYAIPDALNPAKGAQRAPETSSTAAAIEMGLGRIEQEILEAVDADQPGFRGGWISSHYLDQLLDRVNGSRAVPPNRRRELLLSIGYDWHPALERGRTHNVVLPDAVKPKLFIRTDHPLRRTLATAGDVARAYSEAQVAK